MALKGTSYIWLGLSQELLSITSFEVFVNDTDDMWVVGYINKMM